MRAQSLFTKAIWAICGTLILSGWFCLVPTLALGQGLVNGGFEDDRDHDGRPDGWITAGRRGVVQELSRVKDPVRGFVARLTCSQFEAGYPDSHAMLAQMNHVAVQRGQWYRLRLWARAENLEAGGASIGLANYKTWGNVGLDEFFSPDTEWSQFEFFFRPTQDLSADQSRFQIYFQGTGTLYLDDVTIEPIPDFRPQRFPQLSVQGVKNFLPNSSFEYGGAGWGSIEFGAASWGGHVFQRVGTWDDQKAYHGQHSWRLTLSQSAPLVSYFDYFDPSATPIRCLLLAHEGWIPLQAGNRYVFSAYVCADRGDVPVVLSVRQDERRADAQHRVGKDWTRAALPFTAQGDFAYCAVGLDLRQTEGDATIWIDAVQCEVATSEGAKPTGYEPAYAIETAISTERCGNIFTNPTAGFAVTIRAFNAGTGASNIKGLLKIRNYRDEEVWSRELSLTLPAGQTAEQTLDHLLPGQKGFFRAVWQPEQGPSQTLRLAVIDPVADLDTPFGMNHAFSWDFLLDLSHQAGLRWWRDWSCQWRLVQPQRDDPFNFGVPDQQIERVLRCKGQVLMLLPFPATPWSAEADLERIQEQAGRNAYLRERLVVAQKPKDLDEFARYVREAVLHYRDVRVIEILNEPLYTDYALPQSHGWKLADYLETLQAAYTAAKEARPDCLVVGGIAAPPDNRWVSDFILQGGLQWCDVMNIHLYPHRGSPEAYEPAFQSCYQLMKKSGRLRPIWVTEIGCYAEDDPPLVPLSVGDPTMNRSLRANELRAAQDLVKFAAVMGAAGVRKIFYHAGTCGALNENTAGNIFFEFGGAPRKMYPAQAVLSKLLGADFEFVDRWPEDERIKGFCFRSKGKEVVILWARQAAAFAVPDGYQALDIMGNQLSGLQTMLSSEPIYLIHPAATTK